MKLCSHLWVNWLPEPLCNALGLYFILTVALIAWKYIIEYIYHYYLVSMLSSLQLLNLKYCISRMSLTFSISMKPAMLLKWYLIIFSTERHWSVTYVITGSIGLTCLGWLREATLTIQKVLKLWVIIHVPVYSVQRDWGGIIMFMCNVHVHVQ